MIAKRLSLQNFRNIANADIEFSETVNVILGQNAQGKTNLLESLWLFSGNKSFRGSKDADFIKFGTNFTELKFWFNKENRDQSAKIVIDEGKKAYLNDIQISSVTRFMPSVNMTVFVPSHLSLIKDGPSERRKFLDSAIAAIKPSYIKLMQDYYKSVMERNRILKDMTFHSELMDIIFIYEDQIARYGSRIIAMRQKYIGYLEKKASEIYHGISGQKENLKIGYLTKVTGENVYQTFKAKLLESRKEDMLKGSTSVGPHRDDMYVYINGSSAREFGSQGQQRSCVISLKLAESEIQYEVFGEKPVILLDDVMSELDIKRQEYLFNFVRGYQIFITACEKNDARILDSAKLFEVKNGVISNYGES